MEIPVTVARLGRSLDARRPCQFRFRDGILWSASISLSKKTGKVMPRTLFLVVLGLTVLWVHPAEADVLYETDFEAMSLGTINGQDAWSVGDGTGVSTDGMIVDDGAGNQVLEVIAGFDWGDEVRRAYDSVSARRYLVVIMKTRYQDGGTPFWFMDNYHPGPHSPDTILWSPPIVWTNADPGGALVSIKRDTWYEVGLEIDQHGRKIRNLAFFIIERRWYLLF